MNILCTICSDSMKEEEIIYATICGHIFHYHCLAQWIERLTSCPQCRYYPVAFQRNMFRIYPTTSKAPSLQSQMDTAQLQLHSESDTARLQLHKDELHLEIKDHELIRAKVKLKRCLKKKNSAIRLNEMILSKRAKRTNEEDPYENRSAPAAEQAVSTLPHSERNLGADSADYAASFDYAYPYSTDISILFSTR